MDIKKITDGLTGCACGAEHNVSVKAVEIAPGLVNQTSQILAANNFPKNILVVADNNTLKAADGILENLHQGGFTYTLKVFEDLRIADITDVDALVDMCDDIGGVLSVGSGSLNDICRLASFKAGKEFAIFATAPSMDGFASNSAPITFNNFKISIFCHAPSIIIGDTEILAKAPAELKSAGFGDMIAKYVAIVDWKVSHLTTGEYYCPNIAGITKNALERVVSMADRVTANDPSTAGAIMEALVMAGLSMSLANCVRPASGTEHVISHFWEIKKLEQGELSDFHGKKVGVATLLAAKVYHTLIARTDIDFHLDNTNWDEVYSVYGANFEEDVHKANSPTVTDETTPEILRNNWSNICDIVTSELPDYTTLLTLMKSAGAATMASEIKVSPELELIGLKFHPYMRHRMTLMRLIPMLVQGFDFEGVV